MLVELAAPLSTTDLSHRTGITPGGISQHLTTLRAAGLVTTHRRGRSLLNTRTPTAEALLTATGNRPPSSKPVRPEAH
jgi:DNA-binding transcriptional ArsR family regulator